MWTRFETNHYDLKQLKYIEQNATQFLYNILKKGSIFG